MQKVLRSDQRFQHQIKVLFPQIDVDVLCLNEVTNEYLQLLKEDQFIQQNYHITLIENPYSKIKHFCLILSKFPFCSFYVCKRQLISLFSVFQEPILIVS